MKSAFIITMHCTLNYGAILQTYGLQKFLESLGLKVSVINYRPDYIVGNQNLLFVVDRYDKNFFTRWCYRILKAPSKYKRRRYFSIFEKKELNLTQEYKSYQEICKAGLKGDFFICGSDQIWNVVSGSHKDPAYFLSFIQDSEKKISYAASGNMPLANDEVMNISIPMINAISHISLREDTTIASLQPYINKTIYHVCDPVFLLESEKWRKLIRNHSTFTPKEKYVLIYPMENGGENVIQKGYELSRKTRLPLYQISASLRKDKRVDKSFNVSPYDFLRMIADCDYFITNSFHGTSFGIILGKKFWSCVAEGSNQRLSSLLNICKLSSRMIYSDYDFQNPDEEINYTESIRKLNEFVSSSKEYLMNIVQ